MPTPSLDPIEIAPLLAGIILDPKLAAIVGPYAMIFLAAVAGGAIALGENKTIIGRMESFWFLFRGVLGAMIFTVSAATAAARYIEGVEPQTLLLPIAALISGLTGNWKRIFKFLSEILKSWLRNWIGQKGEQK